MLVGKDVRLYPYIIYKGAIDVWPSSNNKRLCRKKKWRLQNSEAGIRSMCFSMVDSFLAWVYMSTDLVDKYTLFGLYLQFFL
jgi:hypothetical protein